MDTITRHHNEPPIAERLAMDHAALIAGAMDAAALVPPQIRPIESDEEAAAYTDTAADIKTVIREADAAFKAEKAPWLAGGKAVDDFFAFRRGLQAAVDRVVSALNARQNALLAAERRRAAEETERARREAIAFDEPPPVAAPVVVKEAARVVAPSGNKASATVRWEHRVTDADAVPRQYLMVNEAAIAAAVKGGTRAIPGVEIFEAVRTSIRR